MGVPGALRIARWSVILSLLAAWLRLPTSVKAASLVVTDSGDGGTGACGATCTLRDAILTAKANADASNTVTFVARHEHHHHAHPW